MTESATSNLNEMAKSNDRALRIMSFSGYAMLVTGAAILLVQSIQSVLPVSRIIPPEPDKDQILAWFFRFYGPEFLGFIGAIALLIVGLKLLGAAGKTAPNVIPSEDRNLLEPLVRDANKEAIGQYVVLSSLSGFTGTFQKIGFSGLPLATVTLTLLFCGLSFLKPDFIEFAKLTLGAFIGSFVQRGTDASKLPSIKWDQS